MYDIKLLKDENIIYIVDNAVLKKGDNPYEITVIITNKRIILLDYPPKTLNYEEDMRIGRGLDYLKKKEEIHSINIEDIKSIIEEKKYNKYILKDTNYFYLFDSENKLKETILKLINKK